MPTAPADTADGFTKAAGYEPLPGYALVEPLGRGGFGEVWRCVAPGGLQKAVKFVGGRNGDGSQFRQELSAFEQIKGIRHPFLLTLERVEVIGDELVMVMELADHQLADRYKDCRADGLPGIPRDELLGYFAEAAEALDVIATRHGLQHLDVKPANLFVTAGHVKVGDYGLVSKHDDGADVADGRGLTPKYVAPEVLRGRVHTLSDQYSLALVYHELLTGVFPYAARTPQQMMLAHVSSTPDVSALPACDQPVVWTALQKNPNDRYPSCLDFVRALMTADYTGPAAAPAPAARPTGGASTVQGRQTRMEYTPAPGELTARRAGTGPLSNTGEMTKNVTLKSLPRLTTQTQLRAAPGLPGLVTAGPRSSFGPPTPPPPPPVRPEEDDLPLAEAEPHGRVRVDPIRSVVAVAQLRGEAVPGASVAAGGFVAGVMAAAAAGGHVPQAPGDFARTAGGVWECRFPSTVPAAVVPFKLGVLREAWGVTVEQPTPDRVVMRRAAPGGMWGGWSGKKAGLELVVHLPTGGRSLGEMTVTGDVYGTPDRDFARTAQDAIPKLLADVRRELGNVEDRRKSPRVAAAFPLTVYPLHSDGTTDPPVPGTCRDVSAGGLCFATDAPLTAKHAYVEFAGVMATAGLAVLVRVARAQSFQVGQPPVYGGQYRTDL